MRKISNTHRLRRKLRSRDSYFHPKSPLYKWFVLANVMVGTFMVVLDSTIVNVSLPKIMSSFGVGLSTIQWVITAYLLSMAAMLPTSGWLADKFGYKKVYFWGLFLFTFGSMLCGLSNDENTLIISRVIQGLGAGIVQPLGMAIITREFPLRQRGLALGFWAIAAAASVSFGPLIGGYLVDNFSWQLIFDVNVPIGILALVFTIVIQREFINVNTRKFDYVGFISVIIFLPVLLYALSENHPDIGENNPWIIPTGKNTAPDCNAVYPNEFCKYKGSKKVLPNIPIPNKNINKLLIPKLRSPNNLRSINGFSVVNSRVKNTASATPETAKQAKMYGADQPAEFVCAFPSDKAYNNTGRNMITDINPT